MKAFCEHHQPWFKCGVCEQARKEAEDLERAHWSERDFMYRRLAGLPLFPAMSCRIESA